MINDNNIFLLIKEAICKYKCDGLKCSLEDIVKLAQDLEELKKNNNYDNNLWRNKCKEYLNINCAGELNTIISYIINRAKEFAI
jgi:hypothetical protein